MLEAQKLTKTFQIGNISIDALRGVDMVINQGDFIAVTGKSGAGKSTLLHQMSLLDTPSSGTVLVHGEDTSTWSVAKRSDFRLHNLGYIFQDYALLPELTASDNVMVPLLMRGMSFTQAHTRASEVLDRVGLGERTNNLPGQLSGGEQQRVSIARSIAHGPQIVFADEPTANLDSVTSKIVMDYLTELNEAGQTLLMVTHEKEYAQRAKKIIEVSDGRIVSGNA